MTAFVPFVQKCLDSTGGSIHAFAAAKLAAHIGAKPHITHSAISMVLQHSDAILGLARGTSRT